MADETLPWRVEPEVYQSGLHGSVPPDLRAPRLYAVESLPDDGARIWLEDVVSDSIVWDSNTYAAAALVFGRLAGRYPAASIPWTFTPMTWDLHRYLESRVAASVVPVLADESTWSHPLIQTGVEEHLRSDLLWL